MNPDTLAFFFVVGGVCAIIGTIMFFKLVVNEGLRNIDGFCWIVIATLTLAWLWIPWLVYGLALLPWSQVRKVLPPVVQTKTLHNPNGGLPKVEKP